MLDESKTKRKDPEKGIRSESTKGVDILEISKRSY